MTLRWTSRFAFAVTVTVLGTLGGLLFERPSLVVLAIPFALAVATGLGKGLPTPEWGRLTLDRDRMTAGETFHVTIEVRVGPGTDHLTVELHLPAAVGVDRTRLIVHPSDGMARVALRATPARWGADLRIRADVTAHDALGLARGTMVLHQAQPLRVYPTVTDLPRPLTPAQLRGFGGLHLAPFRSDGIEYADSRPWVPGDRIKHVNWRISRRRDELWIDARQPEMTGELLLFLDSFTDSGLDRHETLAMAVDAAAALARLHLAANDRVGLVDLGGALRWIEPGAGRRQAYRIVEALVGSELIETWADKRIDIIPVRGLPPRSTVVALTPLLDERAIRAFLDLRARRYDVVVVECRGTPGDVPDALHASLAHRAWELERDNVRGALRHAGCTVASWRPGEPLAAAIGAAVAARRRRVRART